MAKISRTKKFLKVFKRKLLKPISYAILGSFVIYLLVGNIVFYKRLKDYDKPHFVISHISDEFNNLEFMHLLLTIQEINKDVLLKKQLVEFVNMGFPNPCPRELDQELNKMNWYSQAFLIRVKKMFKLYDIYDRTLRLQETVDFLKSEIGDKRFGSEVYQQIKMFEDEKEKILNNALCKAEYEFIQEYFGVIGSIKR